MTGMLREFWKWFSETLEENENATQKDIKLLENHLIEIRNVFKKHLEEIG